MKPNHLYARLELIPTDLDLAPTVGAKLRRVWKRSRARGHRLGGWLLAYFSGSTAPRISARLDGQGNPVFVAYDPVDRVRHTFSSELELRTWIDQRYYQ